MKAMHGSIQGGQRVSCAQQGYVTRMQLHKRSAVRQHVIRLLLQKTDILLAKSSGAESLKSVLTFQLPSVPKVNVSAGLKRRTDVQNSMDGANRYRLVNHSLVLCLKTALCAAIIQALMCILPNEDMEQLMERVLSELLGST